MHIITAGGIVRAGARRVDITPEGAEPMAGYSFSGQIGVAEPGERLHGTIFYLEDLETAEPAAIVSVDLVSGTLALHRAIMAALIDRGAPRLARHLIVLGTHTHTGPGKIAGNSLYDRIWQPSLLSSFNGALVNSWASAIAGAIVEAQSNAKPCHLTLATTELFGVAHNRSMPGWLENGVATRESQNLDLEADQKALDPELGVLTLHDGGAHLASLFWYGCHATSLGQNHPTFHRDWPGVASDFVEQHLGGLCAFANGVGGDVNCRIRRLEDPKTGKLQQGLELCNAMGEAVGAALTPLVEAALNHHPDTVLPIRLDTGVFRPTEPPSGVRWQLGVPVLGGSEDGGPNFTKIAWLNRFFGEGYRSRFGDQAPKRPALGPLQNVLHAFLAPSPLHPWHRLRLGEHLLVTVPGEPTTEAGTFLRSSTRARFQAEAVSVLGYAGDYAGYFTTPAEYDAQQYEGASTLYGRSSLFDFCEQLQGRPVGVPLPNFPAAIPAPLPVRGTRLLLERAILWHPRDSRPRASFATPVAHGELPTVLVHFADGTTERAVVRRADHPDPVGFPDGSVWQATWPGGGRPDPIRISVTSGGQTTQRDCLGEAEAAERFAHPSQKTAWPERPRAERWLLSLGAVTALLMAVSLLFPQFLLRAGGLADTPITELLVRLIGCYFGLLTTSAWRSRLGSDGQAMTGLAHAAFALSGALLILSVCGHPWALALSIALVVPAIGAYAAATDAPIRQPGEESRHSGLFINIGIACFIAGVALQIWPQGILSSLTAGSPVSSELTLLRLYGATFLASVLATRKAKNTRDPRALLSFTTGTLIFDGLSALLVLWAGFHRNLTGWGALTSGAAFSLFAVYCGARRGRVLHEMRTVPGEPLSVQELQSLVNQARQEKATIRVLGSGHSVADAIFTDQRPGVSSVRPPEALDRTLSLESLDRLISVDKDLKTVTVQAGLHIGESPNFVKSLSPHHLIAYLDQFNLALPDLGGIVHQSVAGFLATGSSGGSLTRSAASAVVEMRLVDGLGNIRVVRADEALSLDAALVNLGLLGVIYEITFVCESAYMVGGQEVTADVQGNILHVPKSSLGLPGGGKLDLTAPSSLANYFAKVEYHRILWWPQAKVSKMVLWEGERRLTPAAEYRPHEADSPLLQSAGSLLMGLIGKSYDPGWIGALAGLLKGAFHRLAPAFMPAEPKSFYAKWHENLPMDTRVDDFLLPVEFTELWFPLERTHEVMSVLLSLYNDPDDRVAEKHAGFFACELYCAQASSAWLSPAHGRDSFRVDLFWFARNPSDPRRYFSPFWKALAPLSFRAHWGKYLPPAGSDEGAALLRAEYAPNLEAFLRLRQELDPNGVFLSRYWRRHLGI